MKENYIKKGLLIILCLCFSPLAFSQIIADATYKILNSVNSEVISINTIPEGDPNNPDNLVLGRAIMAAVDENDDNQLWTFTHQGNDVYRIENVGDNSFLGIKDGWCGQFGDVQVGFDNANPWALIRVNTADEADTYVFEIAFDADCNFGSTNMPVKAFDIDGGNVGAKLQTFDVNTGNPNQQFQIVDPATLSNSSFNLEEIVFSYSKRDRFLSVKAPSSVEISKVQVFDMSGREVKRISSQEKDVDTMINFQEINNGLYIIRIESQSSFITKKVLIH